MHGSRWLAAAIVAGMAAAPGLAEAQTTTFQHTGGEQHYLVPSGVFELDVVATGGAGSANETVGGEPRAGGVPARVRGRVPVTPGERLVVVVGGRGTTSAGGYNGGGFSRPILNGIFVRQPGGGGGASDVRTLACGAACPGTDGSLRTRLIVAGGGGGAGASANTSGTYGGRLGGRGGQAGGEGEGSGEIRGGYGGQRGWPDRGGLGGHAPDSGPHVGQNGALGRGGTGGQGSARGGAGAGGGVFGGGGGSGAPQAGNDGPLAGGGGGGGGSLIPPGGTLERPNPAPAPSVVITAIDTGRPTTAIGDGPGEGTTTATATPTFAFAADEVATYACSLNGAAFEACASPLQLGPLPDGEHELRIRATDAAGNVEDPPVARRFRVAVPPPDDGGDGPGDGPGGGGDEPGDGPGGGGPAGGGDARGEPSPGASVPPAVAAPPAVGPPAAEPARDRAAPRLRIRQARLSSGRRRLALAARIDPRAAGSPVRVILQRRGVRIALRARVVRRAGKPGQVRLRTRVPARLAARRGPLRVTVRFAGNTRLRPAIARVRLR